LAFCRKHIHWLGDYALFMALKGQFGGRPWQEWEEDIRLREPAALRRYRTLLKDDIAYHKYLQYLFFKQWAALKEYAAAQGVGLIGDIPLYVSMDSADVWSNP
ncbi:4-alpha-glucanotransferase, partial [Bittarella massiliensis (ex Durand et al. 2017)]